MTADKQTIGETDIAIVGMAAHLPGAADISTYWRNLRDGVSSIRRLSDADLTEAGEDPGLRRHRDYVPFAAPLDDFDLFDAEFFGFSPKEAAIMDPQHRQFLETAWEALENAGQVPEKFPGQVGVFAGCGMGSYFYFNVCSNPDLVENTGMFLLRHTGNDKDFMTTRLSHVLDLHGPSINLQTACSTSLVATHYAVQALLNGECDLALAGGVTIELPQGRGYLYKENEILSPDGACHAFDHRAQGTVFGSGAGVVVLRRAVDAIADGDHIWSIIKGSAVNNDGAQKAGYLAPSVDGQATAVAEAQALSDVTADTIDYVECHGTGTYLGDPIEVAALTQAFRETSDAVGHCRIGSVKTNIGHLDTAAGVASLIKASLALHHKQMPPSLGYEKPNAAIDFENSPFRVNDRLTPWQMGAHPRRAGVNSLGVGGTNAHVILEEAPERGASGTSDWPFQILTLSARSKTALDEQSKRLAEHLRSHPEQSLADVAFTLKQGRRAFDKRRIVVAETHDDAARLLIDETPRRVHSHSALTAPDLVFMFPGGGAQYAGMARDLYETEPEFAEWMDRGLAHLATLTEVDMRALWLPERGEEAAADLALQKPSLQLPLIMIVEYALAQMWMGWGLTPSALTGHSMGENTAACLAGVIGFEDCIGLVHLRGSLFDEVPAGGMLSVNLPADDLRGYLSEDLDLGAVNAPELSVASGPQAALDALEAKLKAKDIECQRIAIDIAAHSRMLDPILDRFRTYLQGITLNAPQIPLTSNRTGALMTAEQATSPEYWVEHLRGTVHFADGIATLAQTDRVFLEVGPGKAMSALTRQHPDVSANQVLSSLRHPQDQIDDDKHMFEVLGRLWALGAEVDWGQIWGEGPRHRVPLPTYAFQRASYFIEPGQAVESSPQFLMRGDDIAEWGWKPVWRPRSAALEIGDISEADPQVWLMFVDDGGLATRAAARLRGAGHQVIEVRPSDGFARLYDTRYVLAPEQGRMGYDQLIADLVERGLAPTRIAHFWMVTKDESHRPGSSFFHRIQEQGFYSLLFLAQALADDGSSTPHITVVTNGAAQLRDEALYYPGKATIAGPARVIPRELPGVTVSTLDLELPQRVDAQFWKRAQAEAASDQAWSRVTERVLEDLLAEPGNSIAALRTDRRFECAMKPVALPEMDHHGTSGVYLITGGFGGIGLSLAEDFARAGATLILLARKALPDRRDWADFLARHAPQDQIARRIRAVQALEEAGGTIVIRAADVCNLDQMQELRTEIEAEHGRITGIIHGAGVIDDGPLLTKSPAAIEDVFTPKIHGTEILGQVFPDGAVEWMVLFASSSTVTAPAGQVDYVAANEFLNAYAKSRSGKTRVTAINWGIWNEVGMAAEAVAARSGDVPKPPVEPVDFPLLTSATFDVQGNRLFHTSFDQEDWIIDEHRTRAGDALLPGTGYLTLAAQALRAHREEGAFEINDLTFLRPLRVTGGAARDVQIRLSRSDTGYGFDVLADATLNGRQGHALTAQAAVSLLPLARPEPLDLDAIRARCDAPLSVPGQKLTAAQEVHLAFGPRWKVLDARALGQGEGIADLSLPEIALEDACILHPALLDIATGWAMELIEGYQPTHLWVPVRYGRVRVHQDLPQQVVSWVRNAAENRADAETASFDITLCTPDGAVVMEITGFTIRKLESADILRSAPQITAAEIEFGDAQEGQPLSPAEERLAHNLSQGILPREGVEAFHRALALNLPQVVVSSMDLDALTRQTAQSTSTTETQKFDRPQLDGDYVAPENEIERQLVGFWETLLGVQNVGVEDSFFDLGGHSLIAVRLFAMVKKTFRVDFPISVLFEAPTIRKCAGLIADQVGLPDETSGVDAGSETRPREPSRRFTHLVPMHDGDGGARQPFFLIAGMFGNVLNLRHLAHMLGADRPFYGVQARGLFGGEAPHDSIAEAARDYISEMRQVQPYGPYMIGGFSGGGISAYEIAHQLEAMGEEVSLVVMLDTPLPQRRPLSRKDRLIIQMHKAREKGVFYPVIWAKNRIAWEFEKRRHVEETHVAHGFHNAEIEAAFYRAIATYDVKPWDGRVVLFRPPLVGTWTVSEGRMVDEDRSYVTHDNDWGLYVPGVEVHEVPGDHDSMVLEPNVRVLAALMRDAIQRAETAGEPRGQVLSFPIQAAE